MQRKLGRRENNRNPIVLEASIRDQLGREGIDPVLELIKTIEVEYAFIVSIDWERPEVRNMVNNRNFETVPVDDEKLCADCRKITPGAKAAECKHCKSTNVHTYVRVQRCGRIKAEALVRLAEFLHPKLRANEVSGQIDHRLIVQLHADPAKQMEAGAGTGNVIENVTVLDPKRNIIGQNAPATFVS